MPTIKCQACDCYFEYSAKRIPVYSLRFSRMAGDDHRIQVKLNDPISLSSVHEIEFSINFIDALNNELVKQEDFSFNFGGSDRSTTKSSTYYLTCPCNGHTRPYQLTLTVEENHERGRSIGA